MEGSEGLLALVVEFMAFNNNFLWRTVETKNQERGEEFKNEAKTSKAAEKWLLRRENLSEHIKCSFADWADGLCITYSFNYPQDVIPQESLLCPPRK